MTMMILESGGRAVEVNDGETLMKVLGWGQEPHKPIIMTDEAGQVVGAGFNVGAVNRSMPLIKSLNDQRAEQLRKSGGSSSVVKARVISGKDSVVGILRKSLATLYDLQYQYDAKKLGRA